MEGKGPAAGCGIYPAVDDLAPALDLDALIGGFKRLCFRALDHGKESKQSATPAVTVAVSVTGAGPSHGHRGTIKRHPRTDPNAQRTNQSARRDQAIGEVEVIKNR